MSDGFGDNVRAIDHPDTRAAGINGRLGVVLGFTTPSHGYVTDPIVGQSGDDIALAVDFGADLGTVWVVPDLVEVVDHGAGTTMTIGDARFVRDEEGAWHEAGRMGRWSGFVGRLRRRRGSP